MTRNEMQKWVGKGRVNITRPLGTLYDVEVLRVGEHGALLDEPRNDAPKDHRTQGWIEYRSVEKVKEAA